MTIVIGGHVQTNDLMLGPDGNYGEAGVFRIGYELYQQGYDIFMYPEDRGNDDVVVVGFCGDGIREAYSELEAGVTRRGVVQVAGFGYSHGDGSISELTELLHEDMTTAPALGFRNPDPNGPGSNGGVRWRLSAYIDAVDVDGNEANLPDFSPEHDLPRLTEHHINYYQSKGMPSPFEPHGGATTGEPHPATIVPNGEAGGQDLDAVVDAVTHWTIDEHDGAKNHILQDFRSRLSR